MTLLSKKSWIGICRHVLYMIYIFQLFPLFSVARDSAALLPLAVTVVTENAGQTDLPKGTDPYGTEKYRSASASPQNNKSKTLQKTDTSRENKETQEEGLQPGESASEGSYTRKLKPKRKGH